MDSRTLSDVLVGLLLGAALGAVWLVAVDELAAVWMLAAEALRRRRERLGSQG